MRTVLTLLVIALAFCLIAAFLAVLAVGIGFLFTACVPALQLGHGIIAGAVVAAAALSFFCRALSAVSSQTDDDDGIPEDHPVLVLPKHFLHGRPRRTRSGGKRT